MNGFACPKLKNRRTGVQIELNTNPFSIGRGLACNYILPSKTVSRVHCILEMNEDNSWVLKDTSTNGTFVNGKLVKHVRSPTLKENDIISLDLDDTHSYVFVIENVNDDISDEQLCIIADSVLNDMEFLTSSSEEVDGNEALGATSLPPKRSTQDSTTVNPLLDHMYMAKSSSELAKKARVGRSPRPILGCGNRRDTDNTTHSIQEINPPHCTERVTDFQVDNVDISVSNEASTRNVQSTAGSNEDGRRIEQDVVGAAREWSDVLGNDHVGRDGDDGGKKEEIVVSCSQSNGSTSRLNEGDICPPQPGPSTDKDEKPPEQPDNYEVMENELQCVICSELFIKALTLNCSHTFCKYCIKMWNKNKSDCPICRTKITSMTATIVLDNVIEKVIENSNEEIKQHRRSILEERKKQDEVENKSFTGSQEGQRGAGRGRGRGRGRTARRARGGRGNRSQDTQPRINVLDPVAINIGALVNNVIEVSSDSDWSSDTESMSPNDMQDDYDHDDWYETSRNYWGGYGHCFRCGSPTHWANSCPNR